MPRGNLKVTRNGNAGGQAATQPSLPKLPGASAFCPGGFLRPLRWERSLFPGYAENLTRPAVSSHIKRLIHKLFVLYVMSERFVFVGTFHEEIHQVLPTMTVLAASLSSLFPHLSTLTLFFSMEWSEVELKKAQLLRWGRVEAWRRLLAPASHQLIEERRRMVGASRVVSSIDR